MPDLPQGQALLDGIQRLRKELDAVILAHYYQDGEIQDLADFVGDSLQLSQQAAKTKAKVIVFCGVHFMAETAKILNPEKQVLLPDLDAGCSLADRCPADQFATWLRQYPGHKVVSYINCSAGVKALSDVICTSSNAEKIVNSFPQGTKIVFAPDRHLGAWVEKKTGRDLVKWPGFCIVHEQFTERQLHKLKARHPQALLVEQQNIPRGDRERLYGWLEGGGKKILVEPEALLTEAPKMPGLDGQKMSKSYGNTISLREDPDSVSKKIKTMPTDPARVKRTDPGTPEKCPVWSLHLVYSDEATKQWAHNGCTTAGIGCLECKQPVIDAINRELAPMRERAQTYLDDPTLVKNIIADGCDRAKRLAAETMRDVREAMGLSYP